MNPKLLTERGGKVRQLEGQSSLKIRGFKWNKERIMAGFVGDVGDLSKIIMWKAAVRFVADFHKKLARELSDRLGSILVLASRFSIDMKQAFNQTMNQLETRVKPELSEV